MSELGHLEIVTNNPRLTADFAASHGVVRIEAVEGSPLDVLSRTEELLQTWQIGRASCRERV